MEPTFQPSQPQTSSFNPKMKRSPASERNKEAICQVLAEYVKKAGTRVLEVASGFGVHVAHNAVAFPKVVWQPTDLDPESVESIKAHLEGAGNGAILLFVFFLPSHFRFKSGLFFARFQKTQGHLQKNSSQLFAENSMPWRQLILLQKKTQGIFQKNSKIGKKLRV